MLRVVEDEVGKDDGVKLLVERRGEALEHRGGRCTPAVTEDVDIGPRGGRDVRVDVVLNVVDQRLVRVVGDNRLNDEGKV